MTIVLSFPRFGFVFSDCGLKRAKNRAGRSPQRESDPIRLKLRNNLVTLSRTKSRLVNMNRGSAFVRRSGATGYADSADDLSLPNLRNPRNPKFLGPLLNGICPIWNYRLLAVQLWLSRSGRSPFRLSPPAPSAVRSLPQVLLPISAPYVALRETPCVP